MIKCSVCKEMFDTSELYEYRGAIACEKCFDIAEKRRDAQRQEVIEEQKHKTNCFKGLDFGDNVIGNANKQILKSNIEIAKKESGRLKEYEREK